MGCCRIAVFEEGDRYVVMKGQRGGLPERIKEFATKEEAWAFAQELRGRGSRDVQQGRTVG